MTSPAVQVQWCDTKLRIYPPISNAIETWLGCCTLRNVPDGTHFDVDQILPFVTALGKIHS